MQNKTLLGRGTPESNLLVVTNGESAEIAIGTPVCYAMDGTDNGSKVVLPSTGGVAKAHSLVAGIVVEKNLPIKLPKSGVVQVAGYCPYAKIVRQTRAATTDSWASNTAVAIGDLLVVDTLVNALNRTAAGAASAFYAGFMAAETLASVASSASSTSETRTAVTSSIKTFIRVS
jgi:hypothetical protein